MEMNLPAASVEKSNQISYYTLATDYTGEEWIIDQTQVHHVEQLYENWITQAREP